MAFSKNYLYDPKDQTISKFTRALGHSARLNILFQLLMTGPCTVTDLRSLHPISQPSLSQHLEILRDVHLVTCKEKFPYTYYDLDKKNFLKLRKLLKAFLNKF